jgi:hypothetical protein
MHKAIQKPLDIGREAMLALNSFLCEAKKHHL